MKVAILIGHNEYKQGAFNYLEESEFMFNRRIARKLWWKLKCRGIVAKTFNRDRHDTHTEEMRTTAKRMQSWRDKDKAVSIELHFNSARNKLARGCEVLCLKDAEESFILADLVTDHLEKKFNIFQRNVNGVRQIEDFQRGCINLRTMNKVGFATNILVEPCFGGWRTEESKQIFENEDLYVNVLADSLAQYIGEKDERKRETDRLINEISEVPASAPEY